MSKYLKYAAGVFGVAFILSAIGSISALAGNGPPPGSRDINVRVIAICAAPESVEPHDGGDGEVCLCFGRFFNGFNATGPQPNGQCARSQTGPFCFIDSEVGPLFWKETVSNQSGSTTVEPGQVVQTSVPCPEGKMVLSCEGAVTVGNTTEVAANVSSNIFPTSDGFACRHLARAGTHIGTHVHTTTDTTTSPSGLTLSIDCNNETDGHTNEVATGGGAWVTGPDDGIVGIRECVSILQSYPSNGNLTTAPTEWTGEATEHCDPATSWRLTVNVVCAPGP